MRVEDLIVKSIDEIKSDIKEIKKDVRLLNTFKWKVVGVTSTIAFFFTFVGHVIIKKFSSDLIKEQIEKRGFENENEKDFH